MCWPNTLYTGFVLGNKDHVAGAKLYEVVRMKGSEGRSWLTGNMYAEVLDLKSLREKNYVAMRILIMGMGWDRMNRKRESQLPSFLQLK